MSNGLPAISTVNSLLGFAFPEQALQKSVALAVENELIKTYPKAVVIPHRHRYLVYLQMNAVEFFLFSIFKKKKLEAQILQEIRDIDSQAVTVFVLNKISGESLTLLLN